MNLARMWIKHFRCCRNVEIAVGSMHALVGANNAGKSTILRALDFFFNPSSSKIHDEVFWEKDTSLQIRVEALFTGLTEHEQVAMKGYVRPDGSLHLARTASCGADSGEDEDSDGRVKIGIHCNTPQPKYDWLVEAKINGPNIAEWRKSLERLSVRGQPFEQFLGGKFTVENWKKAAAHFVREHLVEDDYEDTWIANPKGFPNVLKGNLPHFELIPAVRDAADESKVLKTNPFGRLIHEIVRTLDDDLRDEIGTRLQQAASRLNRGKERLPRVHEVEQSLNSFLSELMPADLELEFQAPTVETLLTTPKILVDDGFRGAVDGKGHGLQRAVIFTILRCYAQLITAREEKGARTLILGVEEPELYMHPTAQRTIRRVLRTIADGKDQVLFTTHSPLLVDVTCFDEIVRVEASGKKAGGAKVYQLPMHKIVEDFECRYSNLKGKITADSVRERYSHAYTASRNEGFFAKKVIVVEGQTEGYCLPIYARALGHDLDTAGIAVIESGGKDQIDRLYRVFNELGIPCFVLFDYDRSSTEQTAKTASLNILSFLNEDLDAPTEATVRDSFACFSETWESDLRDQIPNYEALAKNATSFLGKCGKPLQARFIANTLVSQEPPYIPQTLKQIIERAVAVQYKGSCLHSAESKNTP